MLWVVIILNGVDGADASPRSDLASQSQEVRDKAARILQQTFTSPPQTNWDSLMKKIEPGMSKTNVLELLRPFNVTLEGGGGSGIMETERYRLDDLWLVECGFMRTVTNSILISRELTQRLRDVWVAPPSKFTGTWITYYVNGQPSNKTRFKDGNYDGTFIAFYTNGATCYVQHFTNGIAEGEDTGFYSSGKINYKGQYHSNSQVGHWTWYKEDGSIESEKNYDSK